MGNLTRVIWSQGAEVGEPGSGSIDRPTKSHRLTRRVTTFGIAGLAPLGNDGMRDRSRLAGTFPRCRVVSTIRSTLPWSLRAILERQQGWGQTRVGSVDAVNYHAQRDAALVGLHRSRSADLDPVYRALTGPLATVWHHAPATSDSNRGEVQADNVNLGTNCLTSDSGVDASRDQIGAALAGRCIRDLAATEPLPIFLATAGSTMHEHHLKAVPVGLALTLAARWGRYHSAWDEWFHCPHDRPLHLRNNGTHDVSTPPSVVDLVCTRNQGYDNSATGGLSAFRDGRPARRKSFLPARLLTDVYSAIELVNEEDLELCVVPSVQVIVAKVVMAGHDQADHAVLISVAAQSNMPEADRHQLADETHVPNR